MGLLFLGSYPMPRSVAIVQVDEPLARHDDIVDADLTSAEISGSSFGHKIAGRQDNMRWRWNDSTCHPAVYVCPKWVCAKPSHGAGGSRTPVHEPSIHSCFQLIPSQSGLYAVRLSELSPASLPGWSCHSCGGGPTETRQPVRGWFRLCMHQWCEAKLRQLCVALRAGVMATTRCEWSRSDPCRNHYGPNHYFPLSEFSTPGMRISQAPPGHSMLSASSYSSSSVQSARVSFRRATLTCSIGSLPRLPCR